MVAQYTDGGVQYVPQAAAVQQIIYLDFDGELTSYQGELLTVENVAVQKASLTEERIAGIVSSLNAMYASSGIKFVTERPQEQEYSTIYIGKTSSFDQYGTFAGLAETIDKGNLNKSDKAFVLLDSSNTDSEIISTISHEADHITGRLDHGGSGLNAYADTTLISAGTTSAGLVISHSHSASIYSGGVLSDTELQTGGCLYIYNGGLASGNDVYSAGNMYLYSGGRAESSFFRGRMFIYSGGVAEKTILSGFRQNQNSYFYASMHVSSGGLASNTVVSAWGDMHVSRGGKADCVAVHSDGALFISSGGTGTNITLYEGGRLGGFSFNSEKYFAEINNSAVIADHVTVVGSKMYVTQGGVIENVTANFWALMYISSGGSGCNFTIENWGTLYVSSGGRANNFTVNAGGYACVSSGGTAVDVKNRGRINVSEGILSNTTLYAGTLQIFSGGTHKGTMQISSGAVVSAYSGATIDFTVADRKTTDTCLINNLSLIKGAPVYTITVSLNQTGGRYYLAGGASTFSGTVQVKNTNGVVYGNLSVNGQLEYGDTTYFLKQSSGDLYLYVGAPETGSGEVTLYKAGAIESQGHTLSGKKVGGNGSMTVFGGIAGDTVITGGKMYVSSGGSASGVLVESQGYFYVRSGFVSDLTVVSGSADIRELSYAENVSLASGRANVYNGTTAFSNTVSSGGDFYIFGGALGSRNVVHSGGKINVLEGGCIVDTLLSSGATAKIFSSSMLGFNKASNVELNSGATLILESGSILAGEIRLGGTVNALERVSAENADIIFDISERTSEDGCIINDLAVFNGGTYFVTLSVDQTQGKYILAGNASDFSGCITVINKQNTALGTLSLAEDFFYDTLIYSLSVADEQLILEVSSEPEEEKDVTAPVIGSWSIGQSAAGYNFFIDIDATDDVTDPSQLIYKCRYSATQAGLATAEVFSGCSFNLSSADAGKRYYFQFAVGDEAGNLQWSEVNSFVVNDVTAPVLSSKMPVVTVTNNIATVTWERGSDNVGITSYKAVIGNVVQTTSGNSVVFTNIPEGKYTCYIQAFDAAGNASGKTSVTFTVDAPQTGSSFCWSGSEYIYIQERFVTAGDFKLTVASNGELQYMMTDDSLVDAEKDSLTVNNAYLYMNTCWAATASNIFVRAGWGTGLFLNEDALLKYFTQSFTVVNLDSTGQARGVSGGWTRVGIEWLLNGAPNVPWYTTLSRPASSNSGAFYKYSIGSTGSYFSEETANFSNGTLLGFNKYIAGTGHSFTTASIYSSYDLLNSALTHLKDGDAVGMSISWHSNSTLRQRVGGHAVTVYGFVYDESKKGTSGYFTGVIIADSDDDFLSFGSYITGTPATMAENRVKILDIEYNASKGVYVFSDYGSYGVIDGFQYLEQKPDYIKQSTYSCVTFSLNESWNSYYSISTSKESALNGSRKRISTSSDVYIAVSLQNSGLGNSESFSIRAIIDGDEDNALVFSIEQVIAYGENCSETVLNLGKLTHGAHAVVLEVTDGEKVDTISVSNIFVTNDNSNNSNMSVSSYNSYCSLNFGESMTVSNSCVAIGTVVGNNAEQIIQNNGIARQSTVTSGGVLTVEYGGSANTVLIEGGGLLEAFGSVENMRVAGNGFVEAGKDSRLNLSCIEALGTISVFDQGTVTNTEVNGNLVIQNGSALSTKVCANGFFIQMEGSVTSATEVQDGGYHYVYANSIANGNTVTGETALQTVKGTSACAYDNTIDAGMQVVRENGVAEKNVLQNNAVQDVYDGGVVLDTELFSYSHQSIKNATAYNTVIHDTAAGSVLEGALSDSCLVKSGGTLTVGQNNGKKAAVNDLEVEYGGDAIVYAGAVFYGTCTIAGTLTVKGSVSGGRLNDLAADPVLVFDLSGRNEGDDFVINDLALCSDLHFQITLSGDQAPGEYKLASSAPENVSFSVYGDTGEYWGEVSTERTLIAGSRLISLAVENGALLLETELSPYGEFELPQTAVYTDGNTCSWDIVVGASGYIVQFSCDDFASVITVNCSENSISLNNLACDMQWRVRAKECDVWTTSADVILQNNRENSVVNADKDWNVDLLFAQAADKWESGFSALHSGLLGGWEGTGERVALSGKNKLADIFEGSTDANILFLTDDENGDALFVDDIFTSLPGPLAEQQARITQISEIRAGAGDDIVDMTSRRFAYEGNGVTIYGGSGDDTIWANRGNNTLYGDAGNDKLVGGTDNDIIIGGSGDDSMHGGGGEDIFTFCTNWGNDTVEQLEGSSVTLWFESGSEANWNAETLTYTDGANSVTVTGVGADKVTLNFGTAPALAAEAFSTAASEKIFDENSGLIA